MNNYGDFIDEEKLIRAINAIKIEREKLKKQQAQLRTKQCRLNKLLKTLEEK